MKCFVVKNILDRFSISRVIVSVNGRQFDTPIFRQFCSSYRISKYYSSPEHPQANGQAEVTNRTILQSIKIRLKKANGLWVEELPALLWAYQTTPWATTSETPLILTYDFLVVVSTELELLTYRVANYKDQENEEALRGELDLIEEKRDLAYLRMAAYKQRVSQYFNRRVKPCSFQVGDLVLKVVN